MSRLVKASALAALAMALTATVAYGIDPPKPPPDKAGTNPCVQIPVPTPPNMSVVSCPPSPKPPAGPTSAKTDPLGMLVTIKTSEQVSHFEDVRAARATIDDWAEEQVDMPLLASRGLFETTVLTQPGMGLQSQRWVLKGWGLMLPFSILLILLAWLNHARHTLKGTDLLHGRNPWVRLGVPGVCLIASLLAPAAWEVVRAGQEWVWAAKDFDRGNADDVLGVVLPPMPVVSATGPVALSPAGSVAPVTARLGTAFATASGLAVLVLGFLGFLSYLVGRFLIISSGLYLGFSAFSHRLEPAFGWLDLALRTNLLLSLFNGAWLIMRNLPDWMAWTGADAVVLVVLVLPALLAAIYFFWLKRLLSVLSDPLLLGGGEVIERMGRSAGGIGRTLSVAGDVMGVPGLAGAGSRVQSWGARTTATGGRIGRAAAEGDALTALRHVVPRRIRVTGTTDETKSGDVDRTACWQDGNQFVAYVKGVPTWFPTQPSGTHLTGTWRGES